MSDDKTPATDLASWMPTRKRKLKIWAVRSVIALALAYGIVSMNGPSWLIWVAWAYVALTLATAFLLTRTK